MLGARPQAMRRIGDDAGTSSRPNDNADKAAPPAPEGLAGFNASNK